jgi:hypothetical protein
MRLSGRRPPFKLEVELVPGGRYAYACYAAALFLAFLAAPSRGRFYNAFVRGKLPRWDSLGEVPQE